jgi:hypothetical protein
MKTSATILALALMSVTPVHATEEAAPQADVAAQKESVAQEKEQCKQQEQQEGKGEKTSGVICAIKVIFQSRIRRRKDTEPVEMTVGSPPMQTDDTETPGPNNWEVNFVFDGEFGGGEHRIEAPLLDVNYGMGDRVQFKYEVPYVFARTASPVGAGSVSANGVGDSIFGVKYRFYDNNDTGLSFAIYPQIQFRTPGGSHGVSDGKTQLILPIIMTREFEHFSITADAGVEVSAAERRYFASFGVGRRLTDHVALLAEIAGTDLNATDEKRVLLNFGLRRKITDTQSLSGSLGHDIYAGGDQHGQTYFSISYQKLFGK